MLCWTGSVLLLEIHQERLQLVLDFWVPVEESDFFPSAKDRMDLHLSSLRANSEIVRTRFCFRFKECIQTWSTHVMITNKQNDATYLPNDDRFLAVTGAGRFSPEIHYMYSYAYSVYFG